MSGSSIIVGSLAKQFSREEMVMAGEDPGVGFPVSWREDWPEIFYLIKRWPIRRRIEKWWRRLLFPLLLTRCLRLALRYGCNNLVVVFPNEEFLLAGYLTAVLTGAKLYPYFHNTYREARKGLSFLFACWLQARVFSRASHVFVMSQGMVELYRERYPDLDCSALPHSFNESLPDFSPPPEPGSTLHLVISGSIHEVCLDAAVRVGKAISQAEHCSLTLLSGTPRRYLQSIGLLHDGVRHESVSRDDLIMRLKEADIVVLPHGFSGRFSCEEYRTIFPTRTIEYLICGRPILAHSPKNCYLTRFLKQNRCALVVDEQSIPALLEAISRLRTDAQLRSDLVRNALGAAANFHAPRVAKTLRARFSEE